MAAPLPPLVVTGGTGFVGRRLLAALAGHEVAGVTAFARDPSRLTSHPSWNPAWRAVDCDLATTTPRAADFPPGAVVLHLAAATGRASALRMRSGTVDTTRHLLASARAAEARHVVFVSSIATRYPDQRWYHYARAKGEAEALVRVAGIPYSIVRPTMVFGEGSPVERALVGLATGVLPVVPGSGAVRVQPVHVDDLVAFLLALAGDAPAGEPPLEVGGADRLSLREFLALVRQVRHLPPRRPLSVPLEAIRSTLGALESVLGAALPVTAGQLAAFVNDSDAAPSAVVDRLLPTPRGVAAMLLLEAASE